MDCPNCRKTVAVGADECISCGVLFAKFRAKAGPAALFGVPFLFLATRLPGQLRNSESKGTLGTLGGLRSDIGIFYGDEGRFPEDPSELTTGKSHFPPYELAAPPSTPGARPCSS